MQDIPFDVWYFIIIFLIIILWAIAILSFGRISVRHIEREMEKEGIAPPYWDKGVGIRNIMYAMTITRNRVNKVTVFDEQAVIDHARKIDWYLAIFLQISTAAVFILAAITYFIYGDRFQRPY